MGSLVGLPSNPDAQKGTKDLSLQIAQLGNAQDSQLRYSAYRKLLSTRPPKAVPLLVKALPAYPTAAVSLALSLLQSYPRDLSEPAFRKLLSCGRPVIEVGVATILYRYGDKSLVEKIAQVLEKAPRDYMTRQQMLSRLSYVKDVRIQQAVRAWLRPGLSLRELDTILYHLLLAEDPKAAEAVEQLSKQDNPELGVRPLIEAFLWASGRKPSLSSLDLALDSMSGSDFSRLQKYLSRAERLDPKILKALGGFLERNQDHYSASSAMQILAKHGYRKALPTIRKLLASSNTQVSKAAFEALRDLGGMSDKSSLYQLLDSEHLDIALSAADTLRRLDDHTGMARVLEIVKKGGKTRSEAVRVLAEFRSPKVVVPLLVALEDRDSAVRSQAFSGLGKVFRCLYPYKRIDLSKSGYTLTAGPTKRAIAAANLRAWWGRMMKEQ